MVNRTSPGFQKLFQSFSLKIGFFLIYFQSSSRAERFSENVFVIVDIVQQFNRDEGCVVESYEHKKGTRHKG